MSKVSFVRHSLLVAPALALVAFAAEQGKAEGKAAQRVVIVPQDASPFKVESGRWFASRGRASRDRRSLPTLTAQQRLWPKTPS